jgi:FSR family fosmidomycin resistance protein-like MFS transporter
LPLIKILIKSKASLVISLNLLVVIRATLTLAFTGFIPLYLTARGSSTFVGALGLAIFQFFLVAGTLAGGHFFDKIGSRKLLIISFLFNLPLAVLFLQLPLLWGFFCLSLMGFFLASSTSVNILLGQIIAPNNASFMSALMMGLGWGIAGLLMAPVGALADIIGLASALTIVSLLSLAGLMLVLFIKFETNIEHSA